MTKLFPFPKTRFNLLLPEEPFRFWKPIRPLWTGGKGHTVKRHRPFKRRRFKTRRPAFVAMRVKKPWVFFLFRFFGR